MTINDENTPHQEPEKRESSHLPIGSATAPRTEISPEPGHKNDGIYRVAGFWTRLLAFTVDILVIAALNSIIWNALSAHVSSNSFIYQISHVNSLFLGITGTAYFIIMTRYYQQTLGKMIMGIKVIQRSGRPLSWITVVFRELVARTLSQLMGLNLGYIVCWFNSEKRCAHDYLSDTWVVYEKSYSDNHCITVES